MKVKLDKEDLIRLVKSYYPYYSAFDNPSISKNGSFMGGFHDKWIWKDEKLKLLNSNQLFQIYRICKNSWVGKLN